jgi:hypothetical protein
MLGDSWGEGIALANPGDAYRVWEIAALDGMPAGPPIMAYMLFIGPGHGDGCRLVGGQATAHTLRSYVSQWFPPGSPEH